VLLPRTLFGLQLVFADSPTEPADQGIHQSCYVMLCSWHPSMFGIPVSGRGLAESVQFTDVITQALWARVVVGGCW
jgi:hypothetical protein